MLKINKLYKIYNISSYIMGDIMEDIMIDIIIENLILIIIKYNDDEA